MRTLQVECRRQLLYNQWNEEEINMSEQVKSIQQQVSGPENLMSRREFMKAAGLAGLGLALAACTPGNKIDGSGARRAVDILYEPHSDLLDPEASKFIVPVFARDPDTFAPIPGRYAHEIYAQNGLGSDSRLVRVVVPETVAPFLNLTNMREPVGGLAVKTNVDGREVLLPANFLSPDSDWAKAQVARIQRSGGIDEIRLDETRMFRQFFSQSHASTTSEQMPSSFRLRDSRTSVGPNSPGFRVDVYAEAMRVRGNGAANQRMFLVGVTGPDGTNHGYHTVSSGVLPGNVSSASELHYQMRHSADAAFAGVTHPAALIELQEADIVRISTQIMQGSGEIALPNGTKAHPIMSLAGPDNRIVSAAILTNNGHHQVHAIYDNPTWRHHYPVSSSRSQMTGMVALDGLEHPFLVASQRAMGMNEARLAELQWLVRGAENTMVRVTDIMGDNRFGLHPSNLQAVTAELNNNVPLPAARGKIGILTNPQVIKVAGNVLPGTIAILDPEIAGKIFDFGAKTTCESHECLSLAAGGVLTRIAESAVGTRTWSETTSVTSTNKLKDSPREVRYVPLKEQPGLIQATTHTGNIGSASFHLKYVKENEHLGLDESRVVLRAHPAAVVTERGFEQTEADVELAQCMLGSQLRKNLLADGEEFPSEKDVFDAVEAHSVNNPRGNSRWQYVHIGAADDTGYGEYQKEIFDVWVALIVNPQGEERIYTKAKRRVGSLS